MNAKWIALAAALAAPLGATATASAQTTLPVTIARSAVLPPNGGIDRGGDGVVAVTFQNTGSVPVAGIEFGVFDENGGLVSRIEDRGPFQVGSIVNHQFQVYNVTQGDTVKIIAVRLADGTFVANDLRPTAQEQVNNPHFTYDADLIF